MYKNQEENRDLQLPPSPIPYADESEPEIVETEDATLPKTPPDDQSQTSTLTRPQQNVENLLYFEAIAVVESNGDTEEIYLDLAADRSDDKMATISNASEPMNEIIETDAYLTPEESSNTVEMNEVKRNSTPDDEMKDVMEKLDQDLHRIVQMSNEIDRAIAMSGIETQQQQSTPMNQDEEPVKVQEVTMGQVDEEIEVDRDSSTNSNAEAEMYEGDETMSSDRLDMVPMAVEEDDDDYNDIDYIDEDEEIDRIESGEDMQRPFSAEVFERHVQQVIAEDFPIGDNKNTIAPAVHIISSRLNQIMTKEAAMAKNPTEQLPVISPSEVFCELKSFFLNSIK